MTRCWTVRYSLSAARVIVDSFLGDDALPERDLEDAQKHCKKADLTLCLGTSLRVAPANGLPLLSRRMVICNLQATAKDRYASLIINAPCDTIMDLLMRHLTLDIPSYRRTESLLFTATPLPTEPSHYSITITRPSARDPLHCSFIERVEVSRDGSVASVAAPLPLTVTFPITENLMTHHFSLYFRARLQSVPVMFSFRQADLPKKLVVEVETVSVNYNTRNLTDADEAEEDGAADPNRRVLPRKAKIGNQKSKKSKSTSALSK